MEMQEEATTLQPTQTHPAPPISSNIKSSPKHKPQVQLLDAISCDDKFNEWIKKCKLQDIRHIFIKYNMTSMESLSNKSESFRNFMLDQELKIKHSQSMERAVKSIAALEKQQNIKYKQSMLKIRKDS